MLLQPAELLSKTNSPQKLCDLKCFRGKTRANCTKWPGWGWRICNTRTSWDQANDFRNWLGKGSGWVSQKILCILYTQFWSSSCVGALKLRSCRLVQGQECRPTAPPAPDCTWSKPKASSEQNQYHGEVGCKNHHSSARRFKGTPNLNDKIPPKVESPKPNQENKWALIKTNKPPRTKPGQQPRPVFTLSQTSINNPFKRCFYSEQYRYLLHHIFQVKTSSQRCQCFLRSFCFSPCWNPGICHHRHGGFLL